MSAGGSLAKKHGLIVTSEKLATSGRFPSKREPIEHFLRRRFNPGGFFVVGSLVNAAYLPRLLLDPPPSAPSRVIVGGGHYICFWFGSPPRLAKSCLGRRAKRSSIRANVGPTWRNSGQTSAGSQWA